MSHLGGYNCVRNTNVQDNPDMWNSTHMFTKNVFDTGIAFNIAA